MPLKNRVNWITTRREKMSQPQKCAFKKKCQKFKNIIFPFMTAFYKFTLKIETS